jgi:hypothetical protein
MSAAAGYQRMVAGAGVTAKFTFLVHSHMLRMPVGSSSPTTATTRAPSKPISATTGSLHRFDALSVQEFLES